jgi:hypothetical protein
MKNSKRHPVLQAATFAVVACQADKIIEQMISEEKAWRCECGFLNSVNADTMCEGCGKESK